MINDDSYFDLSQIIYKRLEPSQQEVEWVQAQEQISRDITSAFEIPWQMLGTLSQSPMGNLGSREITSGMVLSLASALKQAESDPFFLMAPRTYNTIRWLGHIAKAYPLPARKLRKCHLRKRAKRMQQEKRRYIG